MRTLFDKLTGQQHISHHEMLLSTFTALIVMALVSWISSRFLSDTTPYIVASMGASTVLLLAIPSSPMNRPWALLGSHFCCAVIGVSCLLYIPNLLVAVPVAVASALLAMHYLRCLHPPGGATAMLTVLAGPEVTQLGYQFVLTPVLLNALVLWATVQSVTYLFARATRPARYASLPEQPENSETALNLKPPFESEDLQQALQASDTFIDVNQEALMHLYRQANHHYHSRRLGDLRCADLMIPNPVAAEFGTELSEAWEWLGRHRISAVPVINCARHVIGIITLQDFIDHARELPGDTLEARIHALIRPTPGPNSDKPEVVGQIMTQPVITAPESSRVAELLPLLDNKKIHHLPIVDERAKLVGVLNRDQIVALLQENSR